MFDQPSPAASVAKAYPGERHGSAGMDLPDGVRGGPFATRCSLWLAPAPLDRSPPRLISTCEKKSLICSGEVAEGHLAVSAVAIVTPWKLKQT